MKKNILISSGGSGGHIIPSTIIYEHLKNDFDVFLTTDKRGVRFLKTEKYKVKIFNTPKISKNLFILPLNFILIFFLTLKSILFLKKKNIDILISTGGYMSLPLCIAAKILKVKIYLFEPNMVLGRANRFFLKMSEKIFCYSYDIKNFPIELKNKIILIDPLLRKEFYSIKQNENLTIENKINFLIIGGSQGAELFDNTLKDTIINLSKKYSIKIFHQTNRSNFNNLKSFYDKNNIENQLFDFKDDILEFIQNSNLCITRAGASTLSELTFLNIPYLAVPLPSAKDNHQMANALFYKDKNCCWIVNEHKINKEILTINLTDIIQNKKDYLLKKKNMKKFSYQNSWNKINQKLKSIFNEN